MVFFFQATSVLDNLPQRLDILGVSESRHFHVLQLLVHIVVLVPQGGQDDLRLVVLTWESMSKVIDRAVL